MLHSVVHMKSDKNSFVKNFLKKGALNSAFFTFLRNTFWQALQAISVSVLCAQALRYLSLVPHGWNTKSRSPLWICVFETQSWMYGAGIIINTIGNAFFLSLCRGVKEPFFFIYKLLFIRESTVIGVLSAAATPTPIWLGLTPALNVTGSPACSQ